MKISPAPLNNAAMIKMNISTLNKIYTNLPSQTSNYGKNVYGHIVMKSRGRGRNPELSVSQAPERIVKMYPNGDKILYEFKKLNAYNREMTTVSQIRNTLKKNV